MVHLRRRIARRLLGSSLILMCAGSAAIANVFSSDGGDPREFLAPEDGASRKLLPVGMVSAEFALRKTKTFGSIPAGGGTAFLVSPCYAMTSYHVLFGGTDLVLDPMTTYPVTVVFGLVGTDRLPPSIRGTVRYWGSATGAEPDLALIRLDGCPGATLGWYDLPRPRDRRLLPSMGLAMASISRDRSTTRISLQRECAVHAYLQRRGWLLHDCATREGASGAPILAGLTGAPLVVGVNAGEFNATKGMLKSYDVRHANWAVATMAISPTSRLRRLIDQDLSRTRSVNPLLPAER